LGKECSLLSQPLTDAALLSIYNYTNHNGTILFYSSAILKLMYTVQFIWFM